MRHTLPIALLLLTACPSGVTVPVEDEDMAELDQGESTERDMRVEEDAPLDMRAEADATPACECEPLEVCVEGVCEAAPNQLTITLNDELVYQTTDVQLQYVAAQDALLASWPTFGDHPFDLSIYRASEHTERNESCATALADRRVGHSIKPHVLDALPAAWRSLAVVGSSQCQEEEGFAIVDTSTTASLISPFALTAEFHLEAQGRGDREGETLKAFGVINASVE